MGPVDVDFDRAHKPYGMHCYVQPRTAEAAQWQVPIEWPRSRGEVPPEVSQNGLLLSRRGRRLPANASGLDTHRDSISSRVDCRPSPSECTPRLS